MRLCKKSTLTGKLHTLEIPGLTTRIYREWRTSGKPIQQVMPHISAELREFVMTGITPEEWDEAFKEEK